MTRFLAGSFENIYVIGKAYLFEICDSKKYRIIGFSLKSILLMMGIFVGPWIGNFIYMAKGKDFTKTCKILSNFYWIDIGLFLFTFYLLSS